MKLFKTCLIAIVISLFSSCTVKEKDGTNAISSVDSTTAHEPILSLRWEASGLKTPESVYFDAATNKIYVANMDGDATKKDGNGFISILNLDGSIDNLQWAKGLDAPKGMAVLDTVLYVSDITQLVAIDLNSGKILKKYPVKGAKFLNDVAAGPKGEIYVSDSYENAIYRWSEGKIAQWLKDSSLLSPNGLFVRDGKLLVGITNKILSVDLDTKAIRTPVDSTGTGDITDGLVPAGEEEYFTSDWYGGTWLVGPGMTSKQLLNTAADTINSADIEYIIDKKLLLIPTFLDNRVRAYGFE